MLALGEQTNSPIILKLLHDVEEVGVSVLLKFVLDLPQKVQRNLKREVA